MARQNRTLSIELRLLDASDEQHEACREMMETFAKDIHAAATLLLGGKTKPRVFHFSDNYRVDVGKLATDEANHDPEA